MYDDIIVSVAMVTYNHEKYLRQAIESILMQNVNFKYEIVIGEDCSPDNSREILLEYEKKYPSIFNILYREKNMGPTKNVYDVFTKCKGKYIAILEGDDYWTDPDKLKIQVDFMEKNIEYSGVSHLVSVVNNEEKNIGSIPTREIINMKKLDIIDNIEKYMNLSQETMGQGIHIQSVLFRNIFLNNDNISKLEKLLTKTKYVSDIQTIALVLKMGKIKFINKNMGNYRYITKEGNTSYSSQGTITFYLEGLNAWTQIDKYYDFKYHKSIYNMLLKFKSIYFFKLLKNKDFKNLIIIVNCKTLKDTAIFLLYLCQFIFRKLIKKFKI